MFRNYLAAALRNLVRNWLYAAINVIGLTVAFAAALLIALFVRDDLSFESWMPGFERTYIVRNEYEGSMGSLASDRSEVRMAEWLRSDFSSIENAARLSKTPIAQPPLTGIRQGDVEGNERLYWADPNIFSVLPLPAIAGDPTEALERPDGIVLTRRMARKYFGRDDPIGQTIEIDRQHSMTVTAVLADLPSDTHLNFDFLASGRAAFSDLTRLDGLPPLKGGMQVFTYFRLKPGADIARVRDAMPAFLDRHGVTASLKPATDTGAKITFPLFPIADIHLSKGMLNFQMKPRGNIATDYALGAVAFLLVLVAGINFVSLMTARAASRAVEVGIRKVSGAMRRQLALQFIGESVIYVSMGLALATVLAAALVPAFNAYLQRDSIALDFWRDGWLTAAIVGAALVIGTLAGIYPALVLPSFRPAAVLKGGAIKNVGSATVRRGLVVIQFALLIGVLAAALIIHRQTSFAFSDGMRLESSQILVVRTTCQTPFKDQVRDLPGVLAAACSSAFALNYERGVADVWRAGGAETPHDVDMAGVDFGFFELYGLHPVAGRSFSPDQGIDTGESPSSTIINQTAVRKLGFKSGQDAIGQTIELGAGGTNAGLYHRGVYQVVGVVPDISVDGVHEQINAAAYFSHARGHQYLSIKLRGDNVPETLAAIDQLWAKTGEPRAITRIFLDQRVQELYLDITRQSELFGLFSGIAVFIAALGLFGLSAFTAEARTKEIGIRKAMGASHANILGLVLWEFSKPVLWANAIAWPAGYFVMRRWLEGFAYHIDLAPWMFVAASALALVIALLTVSGHAALLARSQPVSALRYE